MSVPVVASVGHVALHVQNLSAALDNATEVMGLTVSAQESNWTYLTSNAEHHSIQYAEAARDGVDHIAFEASSHDALAEIQRRLSELGVTLIDDWPREPGLDESIAFVGPEDFVLEIYCGQETVDRPTTARGVRPNRFGHINVTVKNPLDFAAFFARVLDFRYSDFVAGGCFMRCNVDHHGIAILPGTGMLHHYAWEVSSIADLARLGDLLDSRGDHLLWGPLRHGIGENIAVYFMEPSGAIVEYYADMERIYNDETFVPREWTTDGHRWYSLWSPGLPDGFVDYGLYPVAYDSPVGRA
jgi:catechol 2,3-dioxygenase